MDAAAASALMESIETWHAEHIQLPRVRGSIRALRERPASRGELVYVMDFTTRTDAAGRAA